MFRVTLGLLGLNATDVEDAVNEAALAWVQKAPTHEEKRMVMSHDWLDGFLKR